LADLRELHAQEIALMQAQIESSLKDANETMRLALARQQDEVDYLRGRIEALEQERAGGLRSEGQEAPQEPDLQALVEAGGAVSDGTGLSAASTGRRWRRWFRWQ
jgi:hypothetical protein